MENASKALIIAGAILLSILIIGLGMFIFNQAKNATSGANLDSSKANAYNSEFESYFGDSVNGTQVRALIDLVRSHDVQNQSDDGLLISLAGVAEVTPKATSVTTKPFNDAKANIKAGKTYKVEGSDYDSKTGYLKTITINEAASTKSGT